MQSSTFPLRINSLRVPYSQNRLSILHLLCDLLKRIFYSYWIKAIVLKAINYHFLLSLELVCKRTYISYLDVLNYGQPCLVFSMLLPQRWACRVLGSGRIHYVVSGKMFLIFSITFKVHGSHSHSLKNPLATNLTVPLIV